jgi:hypothetical protein
MEQDPVPTQTFPPAITDAHNHIVIGGGTSGCIVAARLTE